MKKWLTTKNLCLCGVIAAVYAALTLALPVLSYGEYQCRIAEAMTLLPIVLPQSIPGLVVGCLVSNLLSPVGLPDIIFGTLATLVAACGTYLLRKRRWLAALCPVLANGVIVGAMLSIAYGLPLALTMLQVAVGEAVAVYVLGFAMLAALKKINLNKLTK